LEEKKLIELNLEVGNDNGNSEHDLVINGVVIQQPNVLAKIRKLPMMDLINPEHVAQNIHDNLITTVASTSAAPGIYFVGNNALGSGETVRSIEVGVDNNKLDSDLIVINTLSQIAGFAVGQAYAKHESLDQIELLVKVNMTTGLPVTQFTKNNADAFALKFLKDKHTVIVHVGTMNIPVNIVFEYVKVIPESVPATFQLQHMAMILKSENELTEHERQHNNAVERLFESLSKNLDGQYFKQKRILHVSIGEGTTEYPLTSDIEFDPNFIRGSNNGVGHAIDRALQEFLQRTNLRTFSRQDYSAVLRDRSHKYFALASEIISGYIEEESEEILHHVKVEIQRANNAIDVVAVYGGGSILMREFLKPKLAETCEKADMQLFYVPEEFAVTLEAKGMYEFTESPIFAALKSKYLAK